MHSLGRDLTGLDTGTTAMSAKFQGIGAMSKRRDVLEVGKLVTAETLGRDGESAGGGADGEGGAGSDLDGAEGTEEGDHDDC